tara:strand:+ start:68 stop:847 length:780 start_codon:yes stop_codon:yes gene_type:complete
MTFFEFLDQLILIIKNLSLSFWITVIIISPLFLLFEEIIQTLITKLLYLIYVSFPKKYNTILKFLGFSDGTKYNNLQKLHDPYENKNTITEKLKISEDFLDETRGAMFVYNELSNIILGKIVENSEEGNFKDNDFFDYDLIYKQDYNIKELKIINDSKVIIEKEEGNKLFKISNRFSNNKIRKEVYRENPLIKLPEEFIIAFKTKIKEAEDHFLENIEMYLFQKKIHLRWTIFKLVFFLPLMFFLSELIEEIISFFNLF